TVRGAAGGFNVGRGDTLCVPDGIAGWTNYSTDGPDPDSTFNIGENCLRSPPERQLIQAVPDINQ
ncbi:MAG: hypothetical protein V3T70_02065, partial [Phycisphaerae bacterium]